MLNADRKSYLFIDFNTQTIHHRYYFMLCNNWRLFKFLTLRKKLRNKGIGIQIPLDINLLLQNIDNTK